MPKISVVTVCYNSASTLEDTIRSVIAQRDADYEHIIVDGGSTDGSLDIVETYRDHFAAVISEPDRGIYDAMNKGLRLASGEFVGFLNSDDYFAGPAALSALQNALTTRGLDAVWGDVVQVDDKGTPQRLIKGSRFRPWLFSIGLMPPHPSFYARRSALLAAGEFNRSFRIGGDFDLLVRLFRQPGLRTAYIGELTTAMRVGGASTQGVGATQRINHEVLESLRSHGLSAHGGLLALRYPLRAVEVAQGRLMALARRRFLPWWN